MRTLMVSLLALVLSGGVSWGEKAPYTPEELREKATHVVTGEVLRVYATIENKKDYEVSHYVAEVKVGEVEKGDGLAAGQLVHARYWSQRWTGKGLPEPGTSGHGAKPKGNERVRVYLVNAGHNGFGYTKDGGYTVVGPNGWVRLKE